MTKYYFAGSARVAMRKYTIPVEMVVEYLLGDHLGSTSLTADTTGARVSEIKYKPWGEIRYSWTAGLSTTPAYKLPNYTFTGQFSYMDDPTTSGVTEGFGLMFFKARFYDPYLNHFTQPDSIIPDPYNPQAWDRYAFVYNNPLRYTDPSGRTACSDIYEFCGQTSFNGQVTVSVLQAVLSRYGVALKAAGSAKWTLWEATAVYMGVSDAASALSRRSGKAATTIFRHAFGPMTFTLKDDLGGYFGRAWQGNGELLAGKVTPRLVVHELAHSFERWIYHKAGDQYTDDNPVMMLIQEGVYDVNGNLLTGGGQSNRYNGSRAPRNGYSCDSYVGECQYHSRDVDGWNNEDEDWADIFLNWTYGSFYPNAAGDALNNWAETNMASWLR